MGKFGKKNVVSDDLSNYSIALLGEAGIGKTTIMKQICEKLFGDEGYIIFNIGKEDGISAIDGAIYENIEDWKKFDEVTTDIIKNKQTDYPNLKVVVMDSLDQLVDITTPETIRRWNKANMGKRDFEPAKTLNAAYGGFGRGEAMNCQIILDRIWELKAVGVQVFYIGHVKVRDVIDPITNATYTTLTTDMAQRDFNAFKNKIHLVGIGCIDRTIETEGTGRKNIVTHKEVTVNKVKSETRKIVFRDDNYSVDSKSRFANIVNEIPFDPDEFIKAVKDAIAASKNSPSPTPTVSPAKAEPIAESPIEEPVNPDDTEFEKIQMEEIEKDEPEDLFGMNEPEEAETSDYPENLDKVVAEMFKGASPSLKTKAKDIIKQYGKFKDVDEDGLKEMYDLLK